MRSGRIGEPSHPARSAHTCGETSEIRPSESARTNRPHHTMPTNVQLPAVMPAPLPPGLVPKPGSIPRTSPAMIRGLVREIGLLPFHSTPIEGFSVRELCRPEVFQINDQIINPWYWREEILAEDVVYGQFFDGKLGFIRKDVFPLVVALKRGRRTADELVDAGLIDERAHTVDRSIPAGEGMDVDAIRDMLPEGFKGVATAATMLQNTALWCVTDFQQRRNKRGEPYGWPLCVFGRPEEHGFLDLDDVPEGEEAVRDALVTLTAMVRRVVPDVTEEDVLRMLRPRVKGERKVKSAKTPKTRQAIWVSQAGEPDGGSEGGDAARKKGKAVKTVKTAAKLRKSLVDPIDPKDPVMADALARHAVDGMVIGE